MKRNFTHGNCPREKNILFQTTLLVLKCYFRNNFKLAEIGFKKGCETSRNGMNLNAIWRFYNVEGQGS